MNELLQDVLLIVPCYNEASRLQIKEFRQAAAQGLQFCFANDGSTDGTLALLQKEWASEPRVQIFNAPQNLGKAEVIRHAALDLLKRGELQKRQIQWVGFWDADLATPLSEVLLFRSYHQAFGAKKHAIFGSRVLRLGAHIVRSPMRHYLGRLFATLASQLLHLQSYDSQCGAKLIHVSRVSDVYSQPFLSKWIFDVEMILRLGQDTIIECPVSEWRDVPGSKVKVSREALRVIRDLFRIREKYLRGAGL